MPTARTIRTTTLAALLAGAFAVAGCGGGKDRYANTPRPPATVNVAISIDDAGVRVSPERIGAGPAVLLIANLTDRSRVVRLVPRGRGCVEGDASGPVGAAGNARVPVRLVPGACRVAVEGVRGTRLTVGPQRQSAQGDLLQP